MKYLFIGLFTFALGLAAVWLVRSAYATVTVNDIPFIGNSEIIEVAPPNDLAPPAIRIRRDHNHYNCGFSRR
jgi:hypothetical protein